MLEIGGNGVILDRKRLSRKLLGAQNDSLLICTRTDPVTDPVTDRFMAHESVIRTTLSLIC